MRALTDIERGFLKLGYEKIMALSKMEPSKESDTIRKVGRIFETDKRCGLHVIHFFLRIVNGQELVGEIAEK
jgi:hypothetical protein